MAAHFSSDRDAIGVSCTGRFAPSPTGPLHFGSLLAALASFLDIRAQGGRWLLRIEDLDPPREMPGASDQIIRTLEHYHLYWDGEIQFQSRRHALYQDALDTLLAEGRAYCCQCSRSQLRARSALHSYDGWCAVHPPSEDARCAIRARYPAHAIDFIDRIQGRRHYPATPGRGDFVVFRRDGLFAYQLAVVVDDAEQGINQVLRGYDLIDETPRQQVLQQHLGLASPSYAHIPVLTNALGQKLSKQNLAPALSSAPADVIPQLYRALALLGQQPPPELLTATVDELLAWGIAHWRLERIPQKAGIEVEIDARPTDPTRQTEGV